MAMEDTISSDELYEKLVTGGNIAVVIGRRGSGKTALGFATVEEARKLGKECFIVGFPDEAKKFLPGYVQIIDDMKEAPNGAFVMMDEAVLQYNARMWRQGKNMGLLEIIDLARHKDLSVVFLAINTAMLDPNILRAIDTLIIKEPSLLQEFMERPFLKKFITKVMAVFQKITSGDRKEYAYVFDDKFEGVVKTSLPTFWTDDISKSWKDYVSLSDTEAKGIKVIGSGSLPIGESPICFKCQFFVHTQFEAWCVKGLDVGVTECPQFHPKKQAKIWSFRKEKKPANRAWKNPPGTEQCQRCGNYGGETADAVMCNHYQRPVKFIDGTCPYSKSPIENPGQTEMLARYNPLEEHQLWDEARSYYANFKVRSRGQMVFWNEWKKYAGEHGFKLVKEEEGGTDEYWGGGTPPDENIKTKIHLTPKARHEETIYPMSCNCSKWRTTHICDHANKLAQLILSFAHSHQIPQHGEQWLKPPGDWKDFGEHEGHAEDQKGESDFDSELQRGREDHKEEGSEGDVKGGKHGEGSAEPGGQGEGEGEELEKCETCGGKGEIQAPDFPEGYLMPCPSCHGTGIKGAPRGLGGRQEGQSQGGECSDCEGTGKKPCPSCEGTGTKPGTEGEGEEGHGKECPDCEGTGMSDDTCSSCGGSGEGQGEGEGGQGGQGQGQGEGDGEGEGGDGEGQDGGQGQGEEGQQGQGQGQEGQGDEDKPSRYQIGDRVIMPTGKSGIVIETKDREDGGQWIKVEIEG